MQWKTIRRSCKTTWSKEEQQLTEPNGEPFLKQDKTWKVLCELLKGDCECEESTLILTSYMYVYCTSKLWHTLLRILYQISSARKFNIQGFYCPWRLHHTYKGTIYHSSNVSNTFRQSAHIASKAISGTFTGKIIFCTFLSPYGPIYRSTLRSMTHPCLKTRTQINFNLLLKFNNQATLLMSTASSKQGFSRH